MVNMNHEQCKEKYQACNWTTERSKADFTVGNMYVFVINISEGTARPSFFRVFNTDD